MRGSAGSTRRDRSPAAIAPAVSPMRSSGRRPSRTVNHAPMPIAASTAAMTSASMNSSSSSVSSTSANGTATIVVCSAGPACRPRGRGSGCRRRSRCGTRRAAMSSGRAGGVDSVGAGRHAEVRAADVSPVGRALAREGACRRLLGSRCRRRGPAACPARPARARHDRRPASRRRAGRSGRSGAAAAWRVAERDRVGARDDVGLDERSHGRRDRRGRAVVDAADLEAARARAYVAAPSTSRPTAASVTSPMTSRARSDIGRQPLGRRSA